MYRATIEMTSTTQTINMPESWFPYLVSDVCIHMNPFKHFGSGWGGMLDGDRIRLHVSTIEPMACFNYRFAKRYMWFGMFRYAYRIPRTNS